LSPDLNRAFVRVSRQSRSETRRPKPRKERNGVSLPQPTTTPGFIGHVGIGVFQDTHRTIPFCRQEPFDPRKTVSIMMNTNRSLWVTLFFTLFFSFAFFEPASSSLFYSDYYPKLSCPPCQCPIVIPPKPYTGTERLWDALEYFASTAEVLIRGFSLGFGIRMLKYILLEDGGDNLNHMRDRFWISAVSGIAMTAFIHGISIFVPLKMRMGWFDE
jgi:hypothetical protein